MIPRGCLRSNGTAIAQSHSSAKASVRLVSRNQNDLTAQYSELRDLPRFVKADTAILDGEIVALDEEGRPSFSLMQQRTGFRAGKSRLPGVKGIPIVYYAFDLIYLNGYDLRRVTLEERKRLLAEHLTAGPLARFSDHYEANGKALLEAARAKGLEGIVAKRRSSCYEEKRSSDWRKIKIMRRVNASLPATPTRKEVGAIWDRLCWVSTTTKAG